MGRIFTTFFFSVSCILATCSCVYLYQSILLYPSICLGLSGYQLIHPISHLFFFLSLSFSVHRQKSFFIRCIWSHTTHTRSFNLCNYDALSPSLPYISLARIAVWLQRAATLMDSRINGDLHSHCVYFSSVSRLVIFRVLPSKLFYGYCNYFR